MNSYPRGSEWRKWDLHVHSTASDGELSPKQIIDIAEQEGLSVIAITDHHTVRNVDEAKRLGKARGITVISGVEFRTEYGAKSVHIIGLFPDEHDGIELTQDAIEHLVLDNLGLSRILIETEGRREKPESDNLKAFKQGMHRFQVDLKAASDLVHKYGGLISVHAGNKSNSIEEMKHDGIGKRNVNDVVDSLGPVKEELLKSYIDICEIGSPNDRSAEFYINQFGIPVITASDAHDTERFGKVFTWIKSDPTFEGLRQIIYEPELRVKIQENMPEIKADYQIIESVEINHPDFGTKAIKFNPNLNTIIGGRSSGKSILLGLIAKSANYTGNIKDKKEYNEYIDSILSSLKITWKDGEELANRKVEYFPQTYINGLASNSESTVKLIEDILKDDDERKNAFEEYDSSISKNTVQITNSVENLLKLQYKAYEVNAEMASIGDEAGIAIQINKIEKQIDEVKKKSTVKLSEKEEQNYISLKDEKSQLQAKIGSMQSIEKQLLQLKGEQLVRDISGDLVGLPDDIRGEFALKIEQISQKVDSEWDAFINRKMSDIRHVIDDAFKRISDIELDSRYINGETYYKDNEALTELSKVLEAEKVKEKRIKDLLNRRSDIQKEIERLLKSIYAMQEEYLRLANELCEKVKMEMDEIHISPKVVFSQELFNEIIDTNFLKRSNYIKNLLEYEYVDNKSFLSTLSNLLEKLNNDDGLIKNGKDKKQIIISLLSNNYYKLFYNVVYQGDNLDLMSEGKKAFVILRMLLDFNDNQCPILIDQPEDDLDNRAIFNDLVTYIRNKKQERQIILVTHNPNIVVTADAEEVIVANQNGVHNENKDGVKFDYISGSMENSFKNKETSILERQGIREHICEILEGGDEAFIKRENKYRLKE